MTNELPHLDMSGGKCAICYAMGTRQPGTCIFVNITSNLATKGVCEKHRITQDTVIEYLPGMNSPRKGELERIYPSGLVYYTTDYEQATSKKPIPKHLV